MVVSVFEGQYGFGRTFLELINQIGVCYWLYNKSSNSKFTEVCHDLSAQRFIVKRHKSQTATGPLLHNHPFCTCDYSYESLL